MTRCSGERGQVCMTTSALTIGALLLERSSDCEIKAVGEVYSVSTEQH